MDEDSLYTDKGYISASLKMELAEQGIDFIKDQRSIMKRQPVSSWVKAVLSKRFIIETVFDRLKTWLK